MVEPSLSGLVPPTITRILDLARRHLGMDVAYVSAFRDGQQVYEALDGPTEGFGLAPGGSIPLGETYCRLLVEGELPNVVCDARVDARVRELQATTDGEIGAYIGIPLRLRDGRLYGTFCCLSHTPQQLGARDVRFMGMLAELVVDDLERELARDEKRRAIARVVSDDDLAIALQPIVDLGSGRCLGLEALSRFPPGVGTPDVVFSTARDVGLGLELERLAAFDAYALLSAIPDTRYLSVNLSPATAYELAGAWRETWAVPLHRLVVEITEHEAVHAYAELRDRLEPLRERGLRLAIDDAGAGFASLSHVVELHPDIIKMDRSLVRSLDADDVRRSVVTAFVALARTLSATLVAEGVETRAEVRAARELGAHAAQGFFLARPSTDAADHARWAHQDDLLAEAGA